MATIKQFAGCVFYAESHKENVDIRFLTEKTEIQCPYCVEYSRIEEWIFEKDYIHCDVCKKHDGLLCPICRAPYNAVFSRFKIKQ